MYKKPNPEQKLRNAEYARKWRARRTPEQKAKDRAYFAEYAKNYTPEQKARYLERQRLYERNRPRIPRAATLRRWAAIGWSLEAFDHAWQEQQGKCAICNDTMLPTGLVAKSVRRDHDHSTNKARGLLCGTCNTSIGAFREDPAILQAAIAYLKKWGR